MQNKHVIFFIKKQNSEVVPLSFSKTPPPPKWSPDHFFNFFIFAPFPYFIRTHLVEFCIITESNHDASGFLDDKGLRN